jgi:hypothetical protein
MPTPLQYQHARQTAKRYTVTDVEARDIKMQMQKHPSFSSQFHTELGRVEYSVCTPRVTQWLVRMNDGAGWFFMEHRHGE